MIILQSECLVKVVLLSLSPFTVDTVVVWWGYIIIWFPPVCSLVGKYQMFTM